VVFDALAAEVDSRGGQLAGLGARDTLRTEMGYPLHGHELSREISPLQARCGWAVGWSKDAFWGRDALLAEKQAGPRRLLRGLRAVGRGVPRAEMTVLRDGAPVGITTSGTFSPTLSAGIALALIDTDADLPDGATVSVDVRGRALDCELVKPPFVDVKTR
jgi:aminomethyltransferase